jgi:hypothetical protein
MAGKKQSFSRDDLREEMFFTNFLQDGTLLTNRSKDPKYLHSMMGGAGSPPNYGDHRNLYLYVLAYRGGGHSRVYGTSTQELRDCLYQLEVGKGYSIPHFSLKLRDKEEYLHGTFAEKVFVPSKAYSSGIRGTLPPPLYQVDGHSNALASAEARLIAAKILITRPMAEVQIERMNRTNGVLFGFETVNSLAAGKARSSREGRKRFEDALSANTAFANLLARTANKVDTDKLEADPAFRTVLAGARDFTLSHALWINEGMQSDTYRIEDLYRCHDMFVRSEVSNEEDMMVSGIDREWLRNDKVVITQTRNQVGLWQVSPGNYQWAQEVCEQLVKEREEYEYSSLPASVVSKIYFANREGISDDPLILEKMERQVGFHRSVYQGALPTDSLLIITQDRKLCRAVANRTGLVTYKVSTYVIPYMFQKETMQEDVMSLEGANDNYAKYIDISAQPRIIYTMVDTGSVGEMLLKHDVTDIGEGKRLYSFQSSRFRKNHSGKRVEILSYEPIGPREVLTDGFLKTQKDTNGHAYFEKFIPQNMFLKKLPKFESYARGSSRSSRGSAKSRNTVSSGKKKRYIPSEKE